ncbi:unnamed protein product [Rhizoctonia solani]|uniref:Uncharacterized protein n=1 Tax=Rhizoctonia solani TaxID=456999 RepID=A0A8H3DDF9_9AGAM|nr:unnamed protein product [Rhizoctonia solani]
MPIRDALSRLKGKLKKGLGVGSKDQSPTLSSANLSTISIPAHPDPLPSSAPGQSDLITPPAQGVGNQSSTSTPTIKDYHGTGGVVLPENRLQAPLDDENSFKAPVRLEKDNQPTDHAPRDDHEQDCTAGLVWKGAKLLLQVVNASATVFPPLKSAIGGLNDCINIYEHANKGRKDYGHLLNRIDELLEELQGYLKDKEAMEMTRSVERVCCELDMEVKKLKAKLEGPSAKQWLKAVDAPDEITEYHRRIQELLERLTLNATVNILKALKRQDEKMDKHDMVRDAS